MNLEHRALFFYLSDAKDKKKESNYQNKRWYNESWLGIIFTNKKVAFASWFDRKLSNCFRVWREVLNFNPNHLPGKDIKGSVAKGMDHHDRDASSHCWVNFNMEIFSCYTSIFHFTQHNNLKRFLKKMQYRVFRDKDLKMVILVNWMLWVLTLTKKFSIIKLTKKMAHYFVCFPCKVYGNFKEDPTKYNQCHACRVFNSYISIFD